MISSGSAAAVLAPDGLGESEPSAKVKQSVLLETSDKVACAANKNLVAFPQNTAKRSYVTRNKETEMELTINSHVNSLHHVFGGCSNTPTCVFVPMVLIVVHLKNPCNRLGERQEKQKECEGHRA